MPAKHHEAIALIFAKEVTPADHRSTIHHLSMAAHYYYSDNRVAARSKCRVEMARLHGILRMLHILVIACIFMILFSLAITLTIIIFAITLNTIHIILSTLAFNSTHPPPTNQPPVEFDAALAIYEDLGFTALDSRYVTCRHLPSPSLMFHYLHSTALTFHQRPSPFHHLPSLSTTFHHLAGC